RREVLGRAFSRGIRSSAFAGLIRARLYDYQREGALFAARAGRCLIADEMGLGKTLEAIAAAEILARHVGLERVLVVCPTPLENRLEELVSIVQFVDQHRLGPTFRLLHDHQIREPDSGRVVGYRHLDRIGRTLAPILVRRQKAEVLQQLPERLEKNLFISM